MKQKRQFNPAKYWQGLFQLLRKKYKRKKRRQIVSTARLPIKR